MKNLRILKMMAAVVLVALVFISGCSSPQEVLEEKNTEMFYNVYFGLNDADTGKQELSMEEASEYIRSVISSYGYGYTEHRTYGAYTENGVTIGNDTLLYMLVFVEEENVKKIADDVIEHLNLASVLCEKSETEYMFYVGEEKQQ